MRNPLVEWNSIRIFGDGPAYVYCKRVSGGLFEIGSDDGSGALGVKFAITKDQAQPLGQWLALHFGHESAPLERAEEKR